MSNPIDDLARALASTTTGLTLRQATVQAVNLGTWTATIGLSGSATGVPGVPCVSTYTPLVGDNVLVLSAGPASLLILGTVNRKTDRGRVVTQNTDASGFYTFSHGLGVVPTFIGITNNAPNGQASWPITLMVDSYTASTIKLRAYGISAVYTSQPISFFWRAEA